MSKTKLTQDDVFHLAELSNLHISDKEVDALTSQLDETLEYVKNLKELDTSSLSGSAQTLSRTNIEFDDGEKSTRMLTQEEALKNAKNTKDNFFVVKRIM